MCLEMRRWDEGAKEPHWKVPPLEAYSDRIRKCIVHGRSDTPLGW
jgi:predicted HD phosphohydrolase